MWTNYTVTPLGCEPNSPQFHGKVNISCRNTAVLILYFTIFKECKVILPMLTKLTNVNAKICKLCTIWIWCYANDKYQGNILSLLKKTSRWLTVDRVQKILCHGNGKGNGDKNSWDGVGMETACRMNGDGANPRGRDRNNGDSWVWGQVLYKMSTYRTSTMTALPHSALHSVTVQKTVYLLRPRGFQVCMSASVAPEEMAVQSIARSRPKPFRIWQTVRVYYSRTQRVWKQWLRTHSVMITWQACIHNKVTITSWCVTKLTHSVIKWNRHQSTQNVRFSGLMSVLEQSAIRADRGRTTAE